jgi:hypothetical protein
MSLSEEDLKQLLRVGRESLNTEFKPWFPLSEDSGKATLAKACMALRNADGGFLVIGMNNDGSPDDRAYIPDVRNVFHHDAVQEIVSKYASELFEITVHFTPFEGKERVIVEVPPGIRTPVICRNNLPKKTTPNGHEAGSLVGEGVVYVRTLAANGRPSTSPAKLADWPQIMATCFNNREADIGSFLRRQLSGLDVASVSSALLAAIEDGKGPTPTETVDQFLDECAVKFHEYKRKTVAPNIGYREIAAVITGVITPPDLNPQYLWRLGNTPDYSGWPPFICLTSFEKHAPIKYCDKGVESFIYNTELFHVIDFSRIEASGKFCFIEGLHDDLSERIKPREQLDFVLQATRLTDTIAKILHFSKEFCGNDSDCELTLAIRWTGLLNRRLSSWAHPDRYFISRDVAHQDDILTHATIPVSCAIDGIGLHIESILVRVTRLFGGWKFDSRVIQQIVTERLVNRI